MRGRYAAKREARALKVPALEWAWACPSNSGGHVPRVDLLAPSGLFDFRSSALWPNSNPFNDSTCQLCDRPITRDVGSLDREGSWYIPLLVVQELP